jgi:hypothetical protein
MTTLRNTTANSRAVRNCRPEAQLIQGRKCVVTQIDWTSAPIVKVTFLKDTRVFCQGRDTETWQPTGQRGFMTVKAGTTVHFTRTRTHAGYYYVTIIGESCTCTAGLYKVPCHHDSDAVVFDARKVAPVSGEMAKVKAFIAQAVATKAAHLRAPYEAPRRPGYYSDYRTERDVELAEYASDRARRGLRIVA